MTKMPRRNVSWSDLPPELLLAIATRLGTRDDVLGFRAVCKRWRSSAPFPLLPSSNPILSPLLPYKLPTTCQLSIPKIKNLGISRKLVASCVFLVRPVHDHSTQPWLVTVEEFNPGQFHLREPLSRFATKDLPESLRKVVDLSRFHVLEVGRTYNMRPSEVARDCVFKWEDCSYFNNKVVLFRNPKCENGYVLGDLSAVVLDDEGTMSAIRLKDMRENRVQGGFQVKKFDDVVSFDGSVYAIDRQGRLYTMTYDFFCLSLVVKDTIWMGYGGDHKKRLVESCGELYLVHKTRDWRDQFKVYKLNEKRKKWDEVDDIGDDRILIVTFDGAFFVPSRDLPRWKGNCIVYHGGAFPTYCTLNYKKLVKGLDVSVFRFGSGVSKFISSYAGYSDIVWPPPVWLSSKTCLSERSNFIEDEKVQIDSSSEDGFVSTSELEMPPTSYIVDGVGTVQVEVAEEGIVYQVQILENSDDSVSASPQQFTESATSVKSLQSLDANAAHVQDSVIMDVDSYVDITSSIEIAENKASKEKFEGVYVSSELVPILQKIWDKHGNIIQGHAVHTGSLLTWALESLGNMIVTLQSNARGPLIDSQAEFLNSALLDLQMMHFRLDWLVPFVKCALARHESNKQQDIVIQLEKKKSELLAEVRELDKKLKEHRKIVADCLAESAQSGLDFRKVLD